MIKKCKTILISIITPLFNEEDHLKSFLFSIERLDGDFELILVDGGSTDKTVELIKTWQHKFNYDLRLLKTSKSRAIQMNKGSGNAKGDALLFLHVDCIIPKDSIKIIEKEIYKKQAIGGGFKQSFRNADTFLNFLSAAGNLRTKLTKTFFGDFGIFIKKKIFIKAGGFDEIPYLEDVEFCRKAKKFGRFIQIDRYLVTSSRRFIEKGKLRLTFVFIIVNLINIIGLRPKFFIKYMIEK